MQKIRISQLKEGQVFKEPLFSTSGQKLLNAGSELTGRHLTAITRAGEIEVIMAESVADLEASGLLDRASDTEFTVGQRASRGLITRNGQILVEEGEEIEEHHLDAVREGGEVYMTRKELASHRRERVTMSDALVEELDQRVKNLDLRIKPLPACDWLTPADPSQWPELDMLGEFRGDHVQALRKFSARVEAGVTVPLSSFDPILDELIACLRRHQTRFTQLALLVPRKEDYLPDHAYTVAVLAMATAAQLRWPLECVREVGLAGLLFDLGMLLVPERIRVGSCSLTDIDRSRVQRHPIFTLSMMQAIETVPPNIQLTALQHHERENGSGYPRGSRKEAISDYARVIAVADSFAATTEPRSYRRPKLPYIAMEELLRAASNMQFWKPAVRALIQAAGLFPVGSYVKLSDSRNAHVIASNAKQLDRPTVQPLDVDGRPVDRPIDLSDISTKELAVVRPIAGPTG